MARIRSLFIALVFGMATPVLAQDVPSGPSYSATMFSLEDVLSGPKVFDESITAGALFTPTAAASVIFDLINEDDLPDALSAIDCRPQCGSRKCCVAVVASNWEDAPDYDASYTPKIAAVTDVVPNGTDDIVSLTPTGIVGWQYLVLDYSLHSSFEQGLIFGMSGKPVCTWCSAPCVDDPTRDCGFICYR